MNSVYWKEDLNWSVHTEWCTGLYCDYYVAAFEGIKRAINLVHSETLSFYPAFAKLGGSFCGQVRRPYLSKIDKKTHCIWHYYFLYNIVYSWPLTKYKESLLSVPLMVEPDRHDIPVTIWCYDHRTDVFFFAKVDALLRYGSCPILYMTLTQIRSSTVEPIVIIILCNNVMLT